MPANKKIKLSSVRNQYLLDAGQKKFGATQCSECGIIYQIGDAVDENDHMTYHSALDILKFPVMHFKLYPVLVLRLSINHWIIL